MSTEIVAHIYTVEFADGPDAGDVKLVAHQPCSHRLTPHEWVVPSPTGRGYYRLRVAGPGYMEAYHVADMGVVVQPNPRAS